MSPNYKTLYNDIIVSKFPEKMNQCKNLLSKNHLTALDIIKINDIIFNKNVNNNINQRHRAYKQEDILKILDFQKKSNLNNSQLAKYYKLSRNTIAKWKKQFSNYNDK